MLSKISQTQKDMYFFYHMQNLDFKIVRQESREFWGRVRRPLEKEFGQERVMRRDE